MIRLLDGVHRHQWFTAFLGQKPDLVTHFGKILSQGWGRAYGWSTMDRDSGSAEFPQTRWSVVLRATPDNRVGLDALGELCGRYWYPLYAFARHSGNSAADAEDLVQGFLAKSAGDGFFSRARAEKGKLRTFLLTAFRRYARDEYEKSVAEKRGGGNVVSFDATEAESWYHAEPREATSPEAVYDREWAVTVLQNAMKRLEAVWKDKGKLEQFLALRPHLTAEASAEDFQRIGIASNLRPDTVKVALHRLRAKFGAALREEIQDIEDEGADIEEELAYLYRLI